MHIVYMSLTDAIFTPRAVPVSALALALLDQCIFLVYYFSS